METKVYGLARLDCNKVIDPNILAIADSVTSGIESDQEVNKKFILVSSNNKNLFEQKNFEQSS